MNLRNVGMAVLLMGALVSTGCGAVGAENFDGAYEGDAIDSQSSSNIKTMTLMISATGVAATGAPVTGAYTLKAAVLNVSGTVAGTLTGSNLELTLTPGAGVSDCSYKITGTWQGDRILGAYVALSCPVRSDGTLNLKKR
ncbi:MAG: hypothetical protein ABI672_03885 [Vicinamibacteria bacterium]